MGRVTRAEREMDQLLQLAGLRDDLRKVAAERDQLRAEVERLRGEIVNAYQDTDYYVQSAEDYGRQLTAATARAEAAESLAAGLRGALENNAMFLKAIKHVVPDPIYIDSHGGWSVTHPSDGEVEYSVSLELRAIQAALALTPASAEKQTDEETEADNGR